MSFFLSNLPPDLSFRNDKENDITIIIGENGSGKSRMLRELTLFFVQRFARTIAISNSIHDKFPDKGKGLHLLRDRMGRRKAKRSVKTALLNISNKELIRYKNVAEALEFVKYEPLIGIKNPQITVAQFQRKIIEHEIVVGKKEEEEVEDQKSISEIN